MKKKTKRVLSSSLAVLLCTSLNINPIMTIGVALVDSGVIETTSLIGKNIVRLVNQGSANAAYVAEAGGGGTVPTQTAIETIESSSCDCPDYSGILQQIKNDTDSIDNDTTRMQKDLATIKGYDADLVKYAASIDTTTKAILADTNYIIKQLGYDPTVSSTKPTNVRESFEHLSDQVDNLSHEYRVANIHSLNSQFIGTLWRPKYDEVPNLTEYCTITGGFANTYAGYWNTEVDTVDTSVLPTDMALKELGYDAILRAEGIVPVGVNINLGDSGDESSITFVAPFENSDGNTGDSAASEVVVYDEQGYLDITYNDWNQVIGSYDVSEYIPTDTLLELKQITIPVDNITWLDAVTVLYKALGDEQVTLQSFYSRNPDITVESSPLAQNLPGVVDQWEPFDDYVFATRTNPVSFEITGNHMSTRYDYIYWRKAITDGFVNYEYRDQPISAVDFCTLAMKMMIAYGEPTMTANELQTLLQVYGSYYPIQLGDDIADSWAYLKARGIILNDNSNFPEIYTGTLSRNQLLDMCARIKNKDLRDTYKNIQLAITLNDVVVDNGVYPYYDYNIDLTEESYLTTAIDYTSTLYYDYLFPMTTDVNLGYGGTGMLFADEERTQVLNDGQYLGMVKLDDSTGGHYYYHITVPKEYTDNVYLAFVDIDDPSKKLKESNSQAYMIQLNPEFMTGGIYTQYVIKDGIATIADCIFNTNYYSFSQFPNDADLIWMVDYIRANDDLNPQYALTEWSTPTEYAKVFWNELTRPTIAHAAITATAKPRNYSYWNIGGYEDPDKADWYEYEGNTKLNNKVTSISSVTINGTPLNIFDDANKTIDKSNGSRAVAFVAKSMLIDSFGYSAAVNSNRDLSMALSLKEYKPSYKGFSDYSFYSLYSLGAFLDTSDLGTPTSEFQTKDTAAALQSMDNTNLNAELNRLITGFGLPDISEMSSTGTFHIEGSYDECYQYNSTLAKLLGADDDSAYNTAGDTGLKDTLYTTLETSVLMDRDSHVYISWSEMVKAGIAKSTEADGQPRIKDGIYEFYTNSGIVRIDDTNHIIQIGSQIYVFRNADGSAARTFVYPNDDGSELYFDSICITGISNSSGYVLDTGVAKKTNVTIGEGNYTLMCISADSVIDSTSATTGNVAMYAWADDPTVNPVGVDVGTTAIPVQRLKWTKYDNEQATSNSAGSGDDVFTYWGYTDDNKLNKADYDDLDDENTITANGRYLLSSTTPISNWIMTTVDDGINFYGRLYVFYLKDAFEIGFDSDGDGNVEKVSDPSDDWTNKWNQDYIDGLALLNSKFPSLSFDASFNSTYTEGGEDWLLMTKAALVNLAADTGYIFAMPNCYVRMFDLTNASAAGSTACFDFAETDYEITASSVTDSVINYGPEYKIPMANKAGGCYFLDLLGYVYNLPSVKDFTLTDYYNGRLPLPLATDEAGIEIYNFNMNYYVQDAAGTEIPIGWDLTSDGFVHYRVTAGESVKPKNPNTDDYLADKYVLDGDYSIKAPFDNEQVVFAPAGIYSFTGLFNDTDYDYQISDITGTKTKVDDFYLGTRRATMSSLNSQQLDFRNWVIGSSKFAPFSISKVVTAKFVHKYMPNSKTSKAVRSCYILETNDIYTASAYNSNVKATQVETEVIDWNGRISIMNILNTIDKGTNWWIWVCITLAPFICVILMTTLVGLSFLTESKIWLALCEKFFDPVKILTFGARDSTTWTWRRVLIPCIITDVLFALFANANILRIIIWAVDGWLQLLQRM